MVQRYWPSDVGWAVMSPLGPRLGGVHAGVDFEFPAGAEGVLCMRADGNCDFFWCRCKLWRP